MAPSVEALRLKHRFSYWLFCNHLGTFNSNSTGWSVQRHAVSGVVMVFGALAYKSAKKRWLGEAKSTMTRQLLEIALLVVVCVAVLAQPNLKHLMVTDPIPNVVIPIWAIVAYLVIALKPRVGAAGKARFDEPRAAAFHNVPCCTHRIRSDRRMRRDVTPRELFT